VLRLIFGYGIAGGVIVVVPWAWRAATQPADQLHSDGMLLGYALMLLALTSVFLGIKRYRDHLRGGVIRFLPAFGMGLGISAIASVLYAIGWEAVLAVSGMDFPAVYYKAMEEAARARGASAAELASMAEEAASFARLYANPVLRFGMTFIEMFPVGILVSLLSAGVLRKSSVLPAQGAHAGA
jgi:hypothetical protein